MTAGAKDTAQSLARGDEAEIARLEKMARAMIARDELSAACGALRELCVLAPQRVSAREMLVSALVRRGNFSEAREIADEAAMLGLSSPRLSQLRADLEAMAQSPDATLQGWHADDPYDSSVELVEASAVYEEVSSADADSTIHELRSGARENDSVANMLLGPAARVDESEPTWTASFDVEAEAEPRAVGRAKGPYNAGGRLGRIIAWSLLLALLGAGGLGAYYYLEQRDVGESTLKKAARAARSLEPSGIKAAIAGIDAVKLSFGAQRDRLRAQRMLLVALAELSSGAQLSRMQDNIDADADAEARATKRVAQAVRAIIEGQSPGDVEQRLAKAKSKQHGALISALGAWQAWLRGRSKAARAAVKQALGEDGKSGLALLLRGHLAADAGDVEAARESYAQLISLYPQHELGSWSQAALALLDPAARVVVSDAKRVKATTPLARGLEKVLAAFAAGKRDAAALAATRRALQQLSGNLRAHRVLVAALGRALVASCAFATAHEMA
ncbi:MAG: hypothetical protein KC503_21390, partial [Myxococcales bacterium]|nr:hypothetical protein [Myxococcales bacterium]